MIDYVEKSLNLCLYTLKMTFLEVKGICTLIRGQESG